MRGLRLLVVNILLVFRVLFRLFGLVLFLHSVDPLLALQQPFDLVLAASLQNFLQFLIFSKLVLLDSMHDVLFLIACLVEENVAALDSHRLLQRSNSVALQLVLANLSEHYLLHRQLHVLQILKQLKGFFTRFNGFGFPLTSLRLSVLIGHCTQLFGQYLCFFFVSAVGCVCFLEERLAYFERLEEISCANT